MSFVGKKEGNKILKTCSPLYYSFKEMLLVKLNQKTKQTKNNYPQFNPLGYTNGHHDTFLNGLSMEDTKRGPNLVHWHRCMKRLK